MEWLTDRTDDEAVACLKNLGEEEIAPKADAVTPELMQKWRNAKLGVRAWGVTSIALMQK